VRDLLQHRPVQAYRVARGRAEQDKAQSTDGRVGDERLQVGLQKGYERAVDNVDNPEGRQVRQKGWTPAGSRGIATLIRPYVPSLGRMPESTTFVDMGLET
jgi:hypothetical protein